MSIANPSRKRDHGGGIDAAVARFGGTRDGWLDLSTGINPVPYPVGTISAEAWAALPDRNAQDGLEAAARAFWNIPDDVAVLAAPGASALIARIPALAPKGCAKIAGVTYNEHAAAFRAEGWDVAEDYATPNAIVRVHPNNPDGSFANEADLTAPLSVIDESFCDVTPDRSLIHLAQRPNTLVLKSFGKFWGLAGLRIGFAVGDPALIARLSDMMGPWAVSGPALQVGTRALRDHDWADQTRARLTQDTARMDALMQARGAELVGGTTLFRLYDVGDARSWQDQMAKAHVWTRIFPYSDRWIRLGLPAPSRWDQFEASL